MYYNPGGSYLIVESPDHPGISLNLQQSLSSQFLSRRALLGQAELYRTIASLDFTNPNEPIIVKKDLPKPPKTPKPARPKR